MTIDLHRFIEDTAFKHAMALYETQIRDAIALLSRGEGDPQACIVLILKGSDPEALRYFQQAMDYGLRSLVAEGTSKRPRVYDAEFEVSDEGTRTIAVHEIVPKTRGPRKLAIYEYDSVLTTTVCFGTSDQIRRAAQFPESGYRNPEAITGEDYFVYLQGVKKYLLDDRSGARSDTLVALAAAPNPGVKNEVQLFQALTDGDSRAFRDHLEKRLADHKKQYQKSPNKPEGVICQQALMLCRLAIDRGMVAQEIPYVPVRLLPNYRPVVH